MWEEKEFLICVKTYPEYSSKYIETVCTAAILKDSGKLIRLYPIPFRYLAGDYQFSKYQWVSAKIQKNMKDSRPESYAVQKDSIRLGRIVEAKHDWSIRRRLILSYSGNIFSSIEDLQLNQDKFGTSLGIIKPREILQFHFQKKTRNEIEDEIQKKKQILSQPSFTIDKKDLELIPYKFMLKFNCNHTDCKGHDISILDWEFGQLYRRVHRSSDWREKMVNKFNQISSSQKDLYFFMGNMASRRKTFCILGLFYPPKLYEVQLTMFNNRNS